MCRAQYSQIYNRYTNISLSSVDASPIRGILSVGLINPRIFIWIHLDVSMPVPTLSPIDEFPPTHLDFTDCLTLVLSLHNHLLTPHCNFFTFQLQEVASDAGVCVPSSHDIFIQPMCRICLSSTTYHQIWTLTSSLYVC